MFAIKLTIVREIFSALRNVRLIRNQTKSRLYYYLTQELSQKLKPFLPFSFVL